MHKKYIIGSSHYGSAVTDLTNIHGGTLGKSSFFAICRCLTKDPLKKNTLFAVAFVAHLVKNLTVSMRMQVSSAAPLSALKNPALA